MNLSDTSKIGGNFLLSQMYNNIEGKNKRTMDDSFLAEQSVKGNRNAFKLLVIRYQRMVFSFLGKFLFQTQLLEDLAQETFLRAYRNIADFDAEKGASFSSWLITIARNLAINEKAKKKRRREHPISTLERTHDLFEESPQGILEKRSLYSKVQNAINKLPEKLHAAVVLSYFEELSLEEIAHIEECPVGTVKSRVFRGKQILRQILEKEKVL
jgi:RNA polymerase sigma-70 factor (ECF subfamily)